jgi:hypothetical protein
MRCLDAVASSFVAKVLGEVFTQFHAVAIKRDSNIRNWLLDLPERILCEQSPWCQRKLWTCSWLCLSPVSPFSISVSLDFPRTAHDFFTESLYNHFHGLYRTCSEICTKFDAFLCRIQHEIASGQIQDSKWKYEKNQHFHPSPWNFVHWPLRYAPVPEIMDTPL